MYFYIKIKKCSNKKLFAGIYDKVKDKWQKWLSSTIIGNLIDGEGNCIHCGCAVYHKIKGDYICSSCGTNMSVKISKAPTYETSIDPKTLLNVDDLDNSCDDEIPF